MKTKLTHLLYLILPFFFFSCSKGWLEEKRDLSLVVPTTLQDLQILLNNDQTLNYDTRGITEVSSDDIDVTQAMFDAISIPQERNALLWQKDIFGSEINIKEWDVAYQQILYTNVILEALKKIERNQNNAFEYDNVEGSALFFRSRYFLNLVMTFAKYYDSSTANTDLGIPLKLSADINEKVTRASVQEVYDRITEDLERAAILLPNMSSLKTDPSKEAAFGLLARCYLFMDRYDEALQAADNCLKLNNYLMDFNSLDTNISYPVPRMNKEMNIYSELAANSFTTISGYSNINTGLLGLYSQNDLRKSVFFTKRPDGGTSYRGSYTGSTFLFGGTSTNEILLIRAESKARLNDVQGAMEDLNQLLITRFKTGTFIPLTAANPNEALSLILTERRKELTRRGLRWQDLKRLNREPLYTKTLIKNLNGEQYELPPNDPRYVMPIPEYIIQYTGIEQNER